MNDIQFRQLRLDEQDKKDFKVLHNTLFKNTAMSMKWMNWYFGISENVRVYGAYSGSELVGIWCVEGKNLNVKKGSMHVGRCFSVGVHPSYQRRGIFINLSKFAIEQEKQHDQYEYILGFPQFGRSVIEGHLKAGWEFVQDIDIYSIKPNVIDEKSSLDEARVIKHFDEEEYIERRELGIFATSDQYKNRRWLSHPDNHYVCLSYETSSYIVIKPYGDSCHIVDIAGDDESIVELLEVAKTLAKRHAWKEINMWCASNDRKNKLVKSCGFSIGSERGSGVKLLAVKIRATEPLVLPSCGFSMGVEEPY